MNTAAEQEHIDHLLGSASEAQNCFEEAQLRRASLSSDASVKIRQAIDAGKFVVVENVPYFCKATDACAGVIPSFRSAWDTRAEADAEALRLYSASDYDPDGDLCVLPFLAPDPVSEVSVSSDDDVPF